jgi:hypothetical protein
MESRYIGNEKSWFLYFHCDWAQVIGKYNWYSFTLIKVHFEYDKILPGFEFDLSILGLNLQFRKNFAWDTETSKQADQMQAHGTKLVTEFSKNPDPNGPLEVKEFKPEEL